MNGTYESFCKEDKESRLIKELVELIGEENTLKITKTYGGENIYVPKCEKSAFRTRDRDIYSQFLDGVSLKTLARRHGLAEKTIRDIVRNMESEMQTLRDPERNKMIRADFENGMSILNIAHKHKLSVTFIRTIIENDKLQSD